MRFCRVFSYYRPIVAPMRTFPITQAFCLYVKGDDCSQEQECHRFASREVEFEETIG
jgi:hypothetical protein